MSGRGEMATLSALRLADSALPVGMDSVSYGLEQFIASERVNDVDDLRGLLETYLTRQLGTADLVALRAAHAASDEGDFERVVTVDRRLTAAMTPTEFREASERTGERLLSLQTAINDDGPVGTYAERVEEEAPGNYAVTFGVVAATEQIAVRTACLVVCHEFTMTLLGAAQRLFDVGHTTVQSLLVELRSAMIAAVDTSADRSIEEIASFTPLVDLMSADHERARRRLFLS